MAYRAAVLLHPAHKLEWFHDHWTDRPDWIEDVKTVVAELFSQYLAKQPPPISESDEDMSDWEMHNFGNKRRKTTVTGATELEAYLAGPTERIRNPLEWWRLHRESYPVLSRLAFNLLAIPAV